MNNNITLRNLLRQISIISAKYRDIAKITGDDFNIFRILGMESSEVRLHSVILAEILNPKGKHGLGDRFLRLFLDELSLINFDTTKAKVTVEKSIGYLNSDNTQGGRIDIVIDDTKGSGILIENKIYAGDQHNQLLRYYNYGQNNFSKGHKLIYLTLYGKSPDENSTGDFLEIEKHFCLFSYENDILRWLENCKKEAVNYPLLRETITQYINLIKYLTGKSINMEMGKELIQTLIASEDNFLSAHFIKDSLDDSYIELLGKLHKQLIEESSKLNLEFTYDTNFNSIDSGFSFSNSFLEKRNLKMRFEFEGKRTTGCAYGFAKINNKISLDPIFEASLTNTFIKKFGKTEKATDSWPCWVYFDEYINWNRNTYVEIINHTLVIKIIEKLNEMLDVVNVLQNAIDNLSV